MHGRAEQQRAWRPRPASHGHGLPLSFASSVRCGAVGVPARALAGVGASGESARRARGRGRDDAERSGGSPRVLGCHCKMVLSPRLIVLAG